MIDSVKQKARIYSFTCCVGVAAGVIPASFTDQQAAQRLAVCNDIGEASYIDSLIAASLLDTIVALPSARSLRRKLDQRYDVEFSEDMTGVIFPCRFLSGMLSFAYLVLQGRHQWMFSRTAH